MSLPDCVYFPIHSVKYVSCLGIWWRNDIGIPEKLTFDYLKNKKSFRSKITFFLVSKMLSFRHTKQTSKNVAYTTLVVLIVKNKEVIYLWKRLKHVTVWHI